MTNKKKSPNEMEKSTKNDGKIIEIALVNKFWTRNIKK